MNLTNEKKNKFKLLDLVEGKKPTAFRAMIPFKRKKER
jgi:hypothetical protein